MNTLNTRTEHFGVFSGVFRRDPPSGCHDVIRGYRILLVQAGSLIIKLSFPFLSGHDH